MLLAKPLRLSLITFLSVAAVAGLVLVAKRYDQGRLDRLEYTPAGSDADARALVARMLATNRPWLDPKPIWANYSFHRSYRRGSLSTAWSRRSLRPLHESEQKDEGPFTARWKSSPDTRIGAAVHTPLHSMLRDPSGCTVRMVGAAEWKGKSVVVVDVNFAPSTRGEMGMGVAGIHFSHATYPVGSARIFVDPAKATPLFIEISGIANFAGAGRSDTTWEFQPDFVALDGGCVPRWIEWNQPDSWRSRLEFQVTNGVWFFKRGRAAGGMGKMERWSWWSQRVETIGLRTEELRPGDGAKNLLPRMRAIANLEMMNEWPSGERSLVPDPKEIEVDVDTKDGPRRYFFADMSAQTARYCAAHEARLVDLTADTIAALSEQLPDHSLDAKEEALDKSRPRVIAISPPEDAQGVAPATELRIQFDRPMDPLALKLDWELGGFLVCDFPTYDCERHEFTIPVRLAERMVHQVVINKPNWAFGDKIAEKRKRCPRDGFRSADQQLAGIFVWRFLTKRALNPVGTKPPRPIRISPASGSSVPLLAFVEIQFDEPMAPAEAAPPFVVSEPDRPDGAAGPGMIPRVEFDSAKSSFRVPLLMPSGSKAKFALNGFRSAGGTPAEPIELEYQVSGMSFSEAGQERIAAAAKDPRLLELLTAMKQSRARLTSVSERIQELSQRQKGGLFISLQSVATSFAWQHPAKYFADVTDMMFSCAAFQLGSDGQDCWLYCGSGDEKNLEVCPAKEVGRWDISLVDPFSLAQKSPAEAAAALSLSYAGEVNRAGSKFQLVETWHVSMSSPMSPTYGDLTQWYIDPQTGRPLEIANFAGGTISRTRFLYDTTNSAPPAGTFAVPKPKGVSARRPDRLSADYTNRVVVIHDGADGRMSLRFQQQGPKGTSGSGLN